MREKFFNTEGPMKPEQHYAIPSFARIDWQEIQCLIERERYFLLHAPRQTGKTTAMLEMVKALNEAHHYQAIYLNLESSQVARNDAELGDRQFCDTLLQGVRANYPGLFDERAARQIIAEAASMQRFRALLSWWALNSTRPIVLFLDEVDALIGDTLISLLRQL
ncbi:MAG: ATP-binding protein, partial [Gammaproteobacteria bacterium]|nr:ATP-binding protein [Gammaproteobacteria bacterium]